MKKVVLGITVSLAALAGCTSTTPGAPVVVPVATVVPQSTVTAPPAVVIQPPVTVVQQQQQTTTVRAPEKTLTPCQRMGAEGYSYSYAYNAWVRAGYPVSWDADHDGIPCEQTYGER